MATRRNTSHRKTNRSNTQRNKRHCKRRSFNQKGFIYPVGFFPRYAMQMYRFSRMSAMPAPEIEKSHMLRLPFGRMLENRIVFMGEIQPLTSSVQLHVSSAIKNRLASAAYVVVNLESPLCREECSPKKSMLPAFAMTTAEFARIMMSYGVKDFRRLIVTIANNHTFDRGDASAEETTAELERLGCKVIGTKARPSVMVGDTRIVGCTSRLNPLSTPYADKIIQPDDLPLHDTIPTIVYVHWGWEYYDDPDKDSVDLAKQWSGATGCETNIIGIVGHGPHLLQKVCDFGVPCAFSLGDAIVRSKQALKATNPRALSMLLSVSVEDGRIVAMEGTPVLQSYSADAKNLTVRVAETSDALARFKTLTGH